MNIKYSYTANTSNTKPEWLLRGYTGHEHLPEFNLINMNGRMYDPLIARMLSPDNYVQSTSSTQAYNRYSYAYNNPLKYTDPTGNYAIVDDLIAGGIGGVTNWVSNGTQFNKQGLAYFGVGVLSGWVGLYTFGVGSGIISAVGNGLIQKQDFSTIAGNAFVGGFVGAASAALASTFGGFTPNYDAISNLFWRGTAKAGYSFLSGTVTGSFANMLGQQLTGTSFNEINWESVGVAGLSGGGLAAGISIGFSVYDYYTWDRYTTPENEIDILNKKYGGNAKYMSSSEFEKMKSLLPENSIEKSWKYNEMTGWVANDQIYLFDNSLYSMNSAEITFMHEDYHLADPTIYSAKDKLQFKNEIPAYKYETRFYKNTTPIRYMTRGLERLTLSNRIFSILR